MAKLLRDGGYSYDQSKHLIAEARRRVGLTPSQPKKGSVERLTREELETADGGDVLVAGIRSQNRMVDNALTRARTARNRIKRLTADDAGRKAASKLDLNPEITKGIDPDDILSL